MTWALVERGRATSAVEFVQRRDELGALARLAAAWWGEGFDLLLTPTVQAPAPALGELMEGDPATLLQRQSTGLPLTPFANVSGQPAISVPVDSGVDGLPVGVQLDRGARTGGRADPGRGAARAGDAVARGGAGFRLRQAPDARSPHTVKAITQITGARGHAHGTRPRPGATRASRASRRSPGARAATGSPAGSRTGTPRRARHRREQQIRQDLPVQVAHRDAVADAAEAVDGAAVEPT